MSQIAKPRNFRACGASVLKYAKNTFNKTHKNTSSKLQFCALGAYQILVNWVTHFITSVQVSTKYAHMIYYRRYSLKDPFTFDTLNTQAKIQNFRGAKVQSVYSWLPVPKKNGKIFCLATLGLSIYTECPTQKQHEGSST